MASDSHSSHHSHSIIDHAPRTYGSSQAFHRPTHPSHKLAVLMVRARIFMRPPSRKLANVGGAIKGSPTPSTANNRPSHSRATTEHSLTHLSHNPPPSSSSSKSALVRKPAPRAQLPVSVAQSTASNDNVHDGGVPSSHSVPSELRMELQSDVGSAVDMTGVGTHKYGRPGEPEKSLYQQASRFHSMTPGAANPYHPNMSTSAMNTIQPSGPPQGCPNNGANGDTDAQTCSDHFHRSFTITHLGEGNFSACDTPPRPRSLPGIFFKFQYRSNCRYSIYMARTSEVERQ